MNNSLLELKFTVSTQNLAKILIFFSRFENVSWFKKEKSWEISIFCKQKNILEIYKKKLEHIFKINSKINNTLGKNWINHNLKNEKLTKTEFFQISQGIHKKLKKNKKYSLIIPAIDSFGTGQHESTLLAILAIEKLIKKKKINSFFDLGTGTGILSFVLSKLTKSKIFSCDVDIKSIKNFKVNMKKNKLSNGRNFNCYGFRHNDIRKKSFELIVSNILLKPLIEMANQVSKKVCSGGYLILSGILNNQINFLYSVYYSYNFVMIFKLSLNNWSVIVLRKRKLIL